MVLRRQYLENSSQTPLSPNDYDVCAPSSNPRTAEADPATECLPDSGRRPSRRTADYSWRSRQHAFTAWRQVFNPFPFVIMQAVAMHRSAWTPTWESPN